MPRANNIEPLHIPAVLNEAGNWVEKAIDVNLEPEYYHRNWNIVNIYLTSTFEM